ncbi:TFIID-18kDa-domain-containing protein [Sphaerulina musiva SO2202]|uniref:TFIID-18kDa-domain-containing protein n=1 Tax=Sphaerulina musiva (strain SO2202) TaxID=692275 RepID=M3BWM4_SPHMS|nr:TFIID-18kDa-domain-containing protein [Sphaerulina musiva SO2202]EMF12431.1 TFIID-18kDa-domain-containing protein [Sphaerulina musiva SO2202]
MADTKAKYRTEIQQMMFVSGETGDISQETTSMIESIVQQQVMEMLKRATELAGRRGVRTISTDDLIFLIRHDKAKVSRLRTFLSWKDVRKSAKESDDKGGDAGGAGADDFDLAATANDPVGGPSVATRTNKNKKAKVGLPWDVSSFYSEPVPEREDEEDEEEEEMNAATLMRLKQADERTKGMNAEEYLHFSECRQASPAAAAATGVERAHYHESTHDDHKNTRLFHFADRLPQSFLSTRSAYSHTSAHALRHSDL